MLGITASPSPLAPTPIQEWAPRAGDQLVIDTQETVGYLIHPNGTYTAFPVATGQRRTVHYIGRVYNATTPERQWTVQSTHIKGDRTTFGPTGKFLRLYIDGESTPYGIHGHRSSVKMLAEDERFRSMGCIIVSEEILTIIEQTYELNSNTLEVTTTYGLEKLLTDLVAHITPGTPQKG
ncbi:MAG: L,D-transpeptidase [Candidatus Peregrinibacteria bacterium]|nr:L,D-transpeptidase [Candidatus Peregrinibacteria bacterium]